MVSDAELLDSIPNGAGTMVLRCFLFSVLWHRATCTTCLREAVYSVGFVSSRTVAFFGPTHPPYLYIASYFTPGLRC